MEQIHLEVFIFDSERRDTVLKLYATPRWSTSRVIGMLTLWQVVTAHAALFTQHALWNAAL